MKIPSITFVFFLLYVIGSDAHMRLTNPVPRSSSTGLTSGPCGGVGAKTPVQFTQNDALNVGVDSTSGHSGPLTINLLTNAGAQVKQLTSKSANGASGYTLPIVLDTVCNNCILQAKFASSSTWYSCADITVKSSVVIVDEEPNEEENHNEHNEDSDVIDEENEVGDDNNQSKLSEQKGDVLIQYISIIAASVVVIIVCLTLLICRRNRRRTRLHEN